LNSAGVDESSVRRRRAGRRLPTFRNSFAYFQEGPSVEDCDSIPAGLREHKGRMSLEREMAKRGEQARDKPWLEEEDP